MRYWRDVTNRHDFQAGGLERPDGGLPTRAGTLHKHLNLAKTKIVRFLRGAFGGDLRGERGVLSGTFEPVFACGGPRNGVAVHVSQRHEYVVERGFDVRATGGVDLDLFLCFLYGFSNSDSSKNQLYEITSSKAPFSCRRPFFCDPCGYAHLFSSAGRVPADPFCGGGRDSNRYPSVA